MKARSKKDNLKMKPSATMRGPFFVKSSKRGAGRGKFFHKPEGAVSGRKKSNFGFSIYNLKGELMTQTDDGGQIVFAKEGLELELFIALRQKEVIASNLLEKIIGKYSAEAHIDAYKYSVFGYTVRTLLSDDNIASGYATGDNPIMFVNRGNQDVKGFGTGRDLKRKHMKKGFMDALDKPKLRPGAPLIQIYTQ